MAYSQMLQKNFREKQGCIDGDEKSGFLCLCLLGEGESLWNWVRSYVLV